MEQQDELKAEIKEMDADVLLGADEQELVAYLAGKCSVDFPMLRIDDASRTEPALAPLNVSLLPGLGLYGFAFRIEGVGGSLRLRGVVPHELVGPPVIRWCRYDVGQPQVPPA